MTRSHSTCSLGCCRHYFCDSHCFSWFAIFFNFLIYHKLKLNIRDFRHGKHFVFFLCITSTSRSFSFLKPSKSETFFYCFFFRPYWNHFVLYRVQRKRKQDTGLKPNERDRRKKNENMKRISAVVIQVNGVGRLVDMLAVCYRQNIISITCSIRHFDGMHDSDTSSGNVQCSFPSKSKRQNIHMQQQHQQRHACDKYYTV